MSNAEELEHVQAQLTELEDHIDELTIKQQTKPSASQCPYSSSASNVNITTHPASTSPYVPDFDIPLLAAGGGQNDPTQLGNLGPLADLIGTWVSERKGGFNVMPIPEATAPNGFILKNFFYYEVTTFSAISGKVANRGGDVEQDSYTLFYEQRVFFADGPQKDQLVHAENGAWLNLKKGEQGQGLLNNQYSPKVPHPGPITQQDPMRTIVKQVSVPHGNSILALGGHTAVEGAPSIPLVNALPVKAPECYSAPYGSNIPENPNVNPNIVLVQAPLPANAYIVNTQVLDVSTKNNGDIANVPFIKQHTDVTQFTTTFWLELLSNGQHRLQYSQNISLKFKAEDGKQYVFPHITANTLYKAS